MRPCLGGGTSLKAVGHIQDLYSASRVYFDTARDGVNDGIIERAIHEGIKDLRIAKELDPTKDAAVIADAKDAFRRLGYSEERIERVFAGRQRANPIEELIGELLESEDIDLRNRALRFTDAAADNVGAVAVRRSARAMGEMLYYQQILGVAKEDLVGLDVFAANLKLAIGIGTDSDVYGIAEEFLKGFDRAQEVVGEINYAKTGDFGAFLGKVEGIRDSLRVVDDTLGDAQGRTYGALKELRTKLIQDLGRTGEDTPLSLIQDLEGIYQEIKKLKANKINVAANQAKLKAELDRGILKTDAADQTDQFADNIIADRGKIQDLEEIDSLKTLARSLMNKQEISSGKAIDAEDFSKLENLFGVGRVDEHGKKTKLLKAQITNYMEQADYAAASRSHIFKTEILGYLDTASKESDATVIDMIQRLRVLYAKSQVDLVTVGADQSSRAKRSFASILNELFNPTSGRRNRVRYWGI